MFEIVDKKIEVGSVISRVSSPEAGAISVFIGTTRNHTDSQRVEYLYYEAYRSMSLRMMRKINHDVIRKFGVEKMAITHRIGKVAVEEASVVIAASAGHRDAAFKACRYAIDTLKEIVPIWKKEFMKDGSRKWIANKN